MRRRRLALVGWGGLLALGFAYWLTVEPAPSVRVRWREDVTEQHQASLERRYQLSNGRAPMERSVAYDLLDTRRSNIEAIVRDTAVADTNDIDRERFEVPFDVAYGDEWMWVAHRTPGLRDARLRAGLIAALVLIAGAGSWRRRTR